MNRPLLDLSASPQGKSVSLEAKGAWKWKHGWPCNAEKGQTCPFSPGLSSVDLLKSHILVSGQSHNRKIKEFQWFTF